MSEAGALLHAILAGHLDGEAEALLHLEAALAMEVDPLDYAAHRFGLGDELVMERAALWAGLAFSPRVPEAVRGSLGIRRLDSLGDVRAVRAKLYGRDVVFASPRFEQFIALRAHIGAKPDFRQRLCVVPRRALTSELTAASEERLLDESRNRLARRWPSASSDDDLTKSARWIFVAGLVSALLLAALAPMLFKPLFVPLIGIFLVVPAALKLAAVALPPEAEALPPLLGDADLPIYTVLVPLRDESRMVPQLVQALRRLDYPPEKLDIKFVVESVSAETIAAVRTELADPRFELVVVPDAAPHTKPKALDYALPLARGELLVIYDAEDIPDQQQLRLAASTFAEHPEFDCLQAELVVDNAAENPLTALFAGEYAGQFGLLLPLLARMKLPMPLGGTSNHFRAAALREAGGWDAYNVTEDADLGVRLSRLRYRTATIVSRTREEAPVSPRAWLRQRTRWMKGWMQTFIVHNREPRRFLDDIGWRGFLAFQIYVGSMILSAPLHCFFLAGLVVSVLAPHPPGSGFDAWDVLAWMFLIVGYGGAGALVVAGLTRLGRTDLLGWQLLLPLYWVLHAVSMARAIHELLIRPDFWAKTEHGQTRVHRAVEREPEAQAAPVQAE